jgi:hypothetical protein
MIRLILVCWFAAFQAGNAMAAPIRYDFIATITGLAQPRDFFPFTVGDKVIAGFTVNSSFPDANPSPHVGDYGFATGVVAPSGLIGFHIGSIAANWGQFQYFNVYNDYTIIDSDGISRTSDGIEFIGGGPHQPSLQFSFKSSNPNALSSDRLDQHINPGLFDVATFNWDIFLDLFYVTGTFDQLPPTEVPEPGAFVLLAAMLLAWLLLLSRNQYLRVVCSMCCGLVERKVVVLERIGWVCPVSSAGTATAPVTGRHQYRLKPG